MRRNEQVFSKLNFCRSNVARAHVFMAEAPPPPYLQSYGDRLTRKIDLIWNNRPRNQFIIEVALKLVEDGLPGLAERGLVATALDTGAVLVDDPWVAILVESALHGRVLRQGLPGWELWSNVPGMARRQLQGAATGSRRTIITMTAAACCDDFAPDALIVAHGGSGIPNLPGDPWWGPRHMPGDVWLGPRRQIHLFDFIDAFDIQAERDTYSRLCRYVARPWTVVAPTRWLLWATGETNGLNDPPPDSQSHRNDCPLNEAMTT